MSLKDSFSIESGKLYKLIFRTDVKKDRKMSHLKALK